MLTNYSSIEQGDLLAVEIFYSDQSGSKTRPVLVVSNSHYNVNSGNIVVLSISSAQIGSKYDVELKEKDLSEGNLKKESKILTDYPAAISKHIFLKKIGKITQNKFKEVKQKIIELYSL